MNNLPAVNLPLDEFINDEFTTMNLPDTWIQPLFIFLKRDAPCKHFWYELKLLITNDIPFTFILSSIKLFLD